MAHPAAAQSGLRYAGSHLFEKRKRTVKRIVMTIQTGWNIFSEFFGRPFFIGFGMHTGRQRNCHILVGKLFFTGGFNNMALG